MERNEKSIVKAGTIEFQPIIDIFNEGWNLFLTLGVISSDNEKINRRLTNQKDRFLKRSQEILHRIGLEFLDFSGKIYTPELPVEVLNLGDFKAEDVLYIQKMKRPTIKVQGSAELVQSGIAVVEKNRKSQY